MKVENDLGKDDIKRLVLRLAIPSMIAQFVSVLYSVIDRIYIGNIPEIGEMALAGVGVCGPILTLLSAFAIWIGVGGSPLMSIKLGEGDQEGAQNIIANSFVMLLGMSVITTFMVLCFKRPLLFAFGASESIYSYADSYFTIYSLGTIFALLTLGMNQFIMCQGFAKVAMRAVIIGAIINIILDPIFIFILNLGVAGAAIATVISQVCSTLFVLGFLFSKRIPIGICFKGYSWQVMKKILKVGSAPFIIVALDNIMLISVNMVIQHYAGPSRGDMMLACNAIIQSFMLLITMPLGGMTMGTQAILGYNYGAKNPKRVLEAEKYICIVCLIFVGVMFVIAHSLAPQFASVFTSNEAYIQMTTMGIKIYTLGVAGMAIQYAIVDGFTGMGEVRYAMPLSMFRKVLFFGGVFIIPRYVDIAYVFYAEPISDIVSSIVTTVVYLVVIKKLLGPRIEMKKTC